MKISWARAFAVLATAGTTMLRAQGADSIRMRPDREDARKAVIINTGDRHIGLALLGSVVALVPFDAMISRATRQPAVQDNRSLRQTASQLNRAALPGATL